MKIHNFRHFHFVGIGGIGMSAIAQMLRRTGYTVTGSDLQPTPITKLLEESGIKVHYEHRASHGHGADCLVYSSSITSQNPEVVEARRKKIPVHHRSQILAALTQDKWTVAISGTHGKTTTTSMVGLVFHEARRNPTVVVGARVDQLGGNLLMGSGPDMIIEADESDASFLEYRPNRIIVTNIDTDHMDRFKDLNEIRGLFKTFVRRLSSTDKWFGCQECRQVRTLMDEDPGRVIRYGLSEECDYRAVDLKNLGSEGSAFDLCGPHGLRAPMRLAVFGRHNVINATAAAALCLEEGIPLEAIQSALHGYKGASRRFEVKLETPSLLLVDDYAHHPTEVHNTLLAAKGFTNRRIIAVFQPHRYSRIKFLLEDFSDCFQLADKVLITDIYAAGESPIPGVSSQGLVERIQKKHEDVHYAPKDALFDSIVSHIRKGDFVITLGAGDIGKTTEQLREHFGKGRQ